MYFSPILSARKDQREGLNWVYVRRYVLPCPQLPFINHLSGDGMAEVVSVSSSLFGVNKLTQT